MTKSSYYPPANRTSQWWEKSFPRGVFTKIEKIMFHTTETTGWPSYQSGAIAPTLTYKVATREWRQHNFLDTSARALGDPASTPVKENRDNVIQIEIIWYAKDIGNLPDSAYRDLAAFVAYVREEWGGPSLNYAKVGGPNDNVHLSSAQYDAFNGLIGHANAPSPSTHWDPGKLDYAKIVKYVKELETPTPTPPKPTPAPPPEDKMTLTPADIKAVTEAVWARPPWKGRPGVPGSTAANNMGHQSARATEAHVMLRNISARLTAIEGVLEQQDLEAFKAAAYEAFDKAFKENVTPDAPSDSERVAQIIKDYDENLELVYIPKADRKEPFAIVHTQDGYRYVDLEAFKASAYEAFDKAFND